MEDGKEMRPVYETQAHISAERETIGAVCSVWKVRWEHCEKFATFDYRLLRDGKLMAIAEVKNRNYESNRFPTLILSANKLVNGMAASMGLRCPWLLIVGWKDGVFFWKPHWGMYNIQPKGRTDRGDAADVEPCVEIPVSLFGRVCDGPC